MEDWQRANLDNCLLEITKDLDIRDTILKLRVRNIINEDDEQFIMNDSIHKIDSEKRQKIVDIIKTRGKRAYWAFCHIVKTKTPFIFDFLHKSNDENSKVEEICLDCNGEENLSNCCDCCTGLVNVLKTPEFGIFIEKPEEVLEALQHNQIQRQKLITEVNQHREENEKLCQRNKQLLESKLMLSHQLENREREFAQKEKEISAIKMEKEESKIEKEKAYDSIRKLQVVLSEVDESGDPIYANSDVIEKIKLEYMDIDLIRTNSSASSMASSDASIYKFKYETLEDLLKKQKIEHDSVFTVLEEKLRTSDLNTRQVKEELKAHKDYIKVLNNEKEEAVREKEFLLRKLYEKEKSLSKIKQDKSSLENLYSSQQATIKDHELHHEEFIAEITRLKNENEMLKQNVNNVDNIDSTNQKNKIPVENDENNNTCQDGVLRNDYCRSTDNVSLLKKIDDRFGIKFNAKKEGLLLFGESRISVSAVNYNHLVNKSFEGAENVKVGDFVIMINDENVEEADMNMVRNIIAKNNEYMKMVSRKPIKKFPIVKNLELYHRNFEKSKELGVRLATFFIVSRDSALRDCGLEDMDELVKINNKNVDTLSINDMHSKLIKGIKQRQCDLIIHRYTYLSNEELYARQVKDLNLTPLPEHRKQNSVSSDGSISQVDSPLASRPPMLPPRSSSMADLIAIPHDQHVAHQYTENYATGNYQRVVTKEYDDDGMLVLDSSKDSSNSTYENKTFSIELLKESYETYGLHITGGNKTGIFVEAVDNWKAAQKCNIQVGWKILTINGLSLEKVAFCYAHEVLQKFSKNTKIEFTFESTSMEYYKKIMKKRPYDAFHIETLMSYTARDPKELSFNAGEILCVDDSYHTEDANQPYKWYAHKVNGSSRVCGLIPRQIGNRAPSTIKEHYYEEIDSPLQTEKQPKGIFSTFRKKNVGPGRLYKILEPVGEVLV